MLNNQWQKNTETYQKSFPTAKDKEEAKMRQYEGCNRDKIKPHTCQEGNPWTGEQLYHRGPPKGVKVMSPMSGFPARGPALGGEAPRESDLKASSVWSQEIHGTGRNRDPLLEGAHKVPCASEPRGKKQWPHKKLGQTYLLALEGLLQRWGVVAVAHCGDKGNGSSSSRKYSLVWALPEAAISPTQQPVGSSPGTPQAKQPTRWEESCTHQHKLLKVFLSMALPTRGRKPSCTH